jgi:transcriptional regulator with XRE-family HTH domain
MTVSDAQAAQPPEPAGWEPIVESIGPKVRQVRQQLGLSLQQLAGRSDVSAAAIHKVERGDMVPTVTTLLKLSAALGRPVGFFIDDSSQTAPVAVHRRAGEHQPAPSSWLGAAQGVAASALATPTELLRSGAVRAEVAPGGSSGAVPPRQGEELLLLDSGTLAVEVAGVSYQLAPGDTLQYPTDRNHSWHNPGSKPAVLLCWYVDE